MSEQKNRYVSLLKVKYKRKIFIFLNSPSGIVTESDLSICCVVRTVINNRCRLRANIPMLFLQSTVCRAVLVKGYEDDANLLTNEVLQKA